MSAIRQFLILAVLAIAACAPVYRNHGFIPPETDLAQVVLGQTTVDELPTLIGRPSAQGLLTGSGWYYVGSRWRHYGPYEPDEIKREVVAVSFGENGTVANIERFGLERGRVVTLSRRVTDSGVTEIGLIRQLLGNIGNVNAGQLIEE
jgi:outer membrane protein assembly factor BamE (lipoprotein component of BamABCDE complex)